MNLDRWNGLPPDIRQAFLDASDEAWLEELGHIWRRADDAGIAVSQEAGVDYYRLSPEETAEFEAAVAPVVDRWVADMDTQGIDGAGLVERARAAIAEHSTGGS
jgi:TRAP-type C4-dicarboxylate transport system substrate-binding protein